jgi:hypothetical protein
MKTTVTRQSATGEIVDKSGYSEHIGVSTRTIDRLLAKGLPAIRLGPRTVRIQTFSADRWLVRTFGKQKKVAFPLLALLFTCSALSQIPVWPSYSSSQHLNAMKIYGPIPFGNGAGLLPGTILSTSNGSALVLGGDCGTLSGANNGSATLTNSTVRLTATLPGWDGDAVIAQLWLTSCSNEPNHVVSFSLKAAALGNGSNLTNLTFGPTQTIATNIAASTLTLVNFLPLAVGNGYPTYNSPVPNTFVVFDLTRNPDFFTNTVVAQLAVSYSRFIIPSQ